MANKHVQRINAAKPKTRQAIEWLAKWLIRWSSSQPATDTQLPSTELKLVCISDTHCTKPELPQGDILLHAGDLSINGSFEQLQAQLDWLSSQTHRYKIVIGGNHDIILDDAAHQRYIDAGRSTFPSGGKGCKDLQWGSTIYLENTSITLGFPEISRKLKVFGSPMTPQYGDWAFQYLPIRDVWRGLIPQDTDILITHGPPKSHLDATTSGSMAGCPNLLNAIHQVRPRVHLFGHIHHAHGQKTMKFDAATVAFEKIMWLGGGLKCLGQLLLAVLTSHFHKRKANTILVNAAVVRGKDNAEAMPPVVVKI